MTETIYGVPFEEDTPNSQALGLIKKEDITSSQEPHLIAMEKILQSLPQIFDIMEELPENPSQDHPLIVLAPLLAQIITEQPRTLKFFDTERNELLYFWTRQYALGLTNREDCKTSCQTLHNAFLHWIKNEANPKEERLAMALLLASSYMRMDFFVHTEGDILRDFSVKLALDMLIAIEDMNIPLTAMTLDAISNKLDLVSDSDIEVHLLQLLAVLKEYSPAEKIAKDLKKLHPDDALRLMKNQHFLPPVQPVTVYEDNGDGLFYRTTPYPSTQTLSPVIHGISELPPEQWDTINSGDQPSQGVPPWVRAMFNEEPPENMHTCHVIARQIVAELHKNLDSPYVSFINETGIFGNIDFLMLLVQEDLIGQAKTICPDYNDPERSNCHLLRIIRAFLNEHDRSQEHFVSIIRTRDSEITKAMIQLIQIATPSIIHTFNQWLISCEYDQVADEFQQLYCALIPQDPQPLFLPNLNSELLKFDKALNPTDLRRNSLHVHMGHDKFFQAFHHLINAWKCRYQAFRPKNYKKNPIKNIHLFFCALLKTLAYNYMNSTLEHETSEFDIPSNFENLTAESFFRYLDQLTAAESLIYLKRRRIDLETDKQLTNQVLGPSAHRI